MNDEVKIIAIDTFCQYPDSDIHPQSVHLLLDQSRLALWKAQSEGLQKLGLSAGKSHQVPLRWMAEGIDELAYRWQEDSTGGPEVVQQNALDALLEGEGEVGVDYSCVHIWPGHVSFECGPRHAPDFCETHSPNLSFTLLENLLSHPGQYFTYAGSDQTVRVLTVEGVMPLGSPIARERAERGKKRTTSKEIER